MLEARVNLWTFPRVVKCITTNGFVSSKGKCPMGRGTALQAKEHFPGIDFILGRLILENGNIVQIINYTRPILVAFPVKEDFVINDGTNVVSHAVNKYRIGAKVPGFHGKAKITRIVESAKQLVSLTDEKGWHKVWLPRVGCGAGELDWSEVGRKLFKILDDRFTVVDY